MSSMSRKVAKLQPQRVEVVRPEPSPFVVRKVWNGGDLGSMSVIVETVDGRKVL